jgi:phage terminase large subunit
MQVGFEVHESHAALWNRQDWRYAFLMGGRGNGRSGTASRYAVSQLLGKEYTRGALMRAVHSDIRSSCWSEIAGRLDEQEIRQAFKVNDGEMFIERGGNSLRAMGFKSSSGSLKARLKSLAEFNFMWGEEAEEYGEEEFGKIDDSLRTKKGRTRIVLTLNTPAKNHHFIRNFFDLDPHPEAPGFYIPRLKPERQKDCLYIPGTFRENLVNIDPGVADRYLSYRDTNPAKYWQDIEGLCPDEVRGKIYTGWQLIDTIPKEARLVRFGEDFGWFPDPACAVAVWYWNGSYIIDEVAYGTLLSNEFVAGEIKRYEGWRPDIITTADNAEEKSIAEQRRYGIVVQPCEKGKGSVVWGIKVVSTKKIYVTRRSRNLWESYENYAWAEDRDGNSKGEPDHTWSHAMDAVRYAIAAMHNKTSDQPVRPGPPRARTNVGV